MEEARLKQVPQDPACSFLSFDELSAVLGHEIANPLNNISAAVQLLEHYLHEKDDRVDEPMCELLRLITEEINRLTLLLENFRSLKLFSLELQPTCLTAVVQDCLALESIKAARRRIRLVYDLPLDLPLIVADGLKLKQVLLNLCENAIEAMPDGGTVTVRAYSDEGEVCLDIGDSGEGIPEGVQIFAPFVTTKAGGSGLGLFVARRIVSAHGGTIGYTSKKGEGTIFHLAFPIHSDDESATEPQYSVSTMRARRVYSG
jgi:two-component system, NtrC family, sensor histidine kinase HydH